MEKEFSVGEAVQIIDDSRMTAHLLSFHGTVERISKAYITVRAGADHCSALYRFRRKDNKVVGYAWPTFTYAVRKEEKVTAQAAPTCPACSCPDSTPHAKVRNVVECKACEGLYTVAPIYLGESYEIVKPYWDSGPVGQETYFDFDCLGSKGLERRHGWFNPQTGRITQTG